MRCPQISQSWGWGELVSSTDSRLSPRSHFKIFLPVVSIHKVQQSVCIVNCSVCCGGFFLFLLKSSLLLFFSVTGGLFSVWRLSESPQSLRKTCRFQTEEIHLRQPRRGGNGRWKFNSTVGVASPGCSPRLRQPPGSQSGFSPQRLLLTDSIHLTPPLKHWYWFSASQSARGASPCLLGPRPMGGGETAGGGGASSPSALESLTSSVGRESSAASRARALWAYEPCSPRALATGRGSSAVFL